MGVKIPYTYKVGKTPEETRKNKREAESNAIMQTIVGFFIMSFIMLMIASFIDWIIGLFH